jgi:hypothetical protein
MYIANVGRSTPDIEAKLPPDVPILREPFAEVLHVMVCGLLGSLDKRGAADVNPKTANPSDDDVALLTRLEAGEHTFRPGNPPRPEESFERLVALLLSLRERGLVRFTDSKIMTRTDGKYLGVGPVDLTAAGREALERDRRLGPRPNG